MRSLQVALVHKNFLYDVADGVFGAKTQQAVMALQEMAGLEQTGIMDANTWAALSHYNAKFEPQSGMGLHLYNAEMLPGGDVILFYKNMGEQTATGFQYDICQCDASRNAIGNFSGDRGSAVWRGAESGFEVGPGKYYRTNLIIRDGDTGVFGNGEEFTVEIFSDGVYLQACQTSYTTEDGQTHPVDGKNLYCEIVQ